MADKIIGQEVAVSTVGIPVRYVDQGDGTWALKVSTTGGGGGGGAGYSISDLVVQDSTNAQGIRREKIDPTGTITFAYENFDGSAWTPTPPMVAVAIAPNAGVATSANQAAEITLFGPVTETAPASDTASSGLNGRLQRIAQRITSLVTALGSPFQAGGALGAGSAIIGKVTTDLTTPGTTNKVSIGTDGTVAINAAIPAGTNLVGKVGVDQTTPGTTNLVSTISGQNGVDGGSGATSAKTQRMLLATDDPLVAATGAVGDAAVAAGASGSLLAKLRSISRDLIANVVLAAGENMIGKTVGIVANPSTNFTRPANTTAYAVGQLVANSTTAGSVTALTWTVTRLAAGSATIRRSRLSKTSTVTTNAAFRLHLFSASPLAPTNGDGGVFIPVGAVTYLGALDVPSMVQCTDGCAGNGAPVVGSDITFALGSGQTIYGLIEARGAYIPASAEVFTVLLEIFQN